MLFPKLLGQNLFAARALQRRIKYRGDVDLNLAAHQEPLLFTTQRVKRIYCSNMTPYDCDLA